MLNCAISYYFAFNELVAKKNMVYFQEQYQYLIINEENELST